MTAQEKQRPLIRYAGSAAETSIGSKPIGSELRARVYPERLVCQAEEALVNLPDWREICAPDHWYNAPIHCREKIFRLIPGQSSSQHKGLKHTPTIVLLTARTGLRGAPNEHSRDSACLH